jgi:hypothetical protein
LEFLIWLKATPLAEWVLYWPWANPILLCMHAIGMALVVGCGLMTCLRILGFARTLPLSLFERLIGFAWAGVALNATSGILLFISDGDRYIANWAFQMKLAFIAFSGVSTWLLWRALTSDPDPGAPVETPLDPALSYGIELLEEGEEAAPAAAAAAPAATETFTAKARVTALVTMLCWIFAIIAGRMIAYTLAPGFE